MLLYKQLPQETGQVSSGGEGGGGGGYSLYLPCLIGMCRPKGCGFLHRFGLRTDIDFTHFDLNSGKVSEGTTGVYKRVCLFNSK